MRRGSRIEGFDIHHPVSSVARPPPIRWMGPRMAPAEPGVMP